MSQQVARVVADVLDASADLTVRQIVTGLRAAGHQRIPRAMVEDALTSDPRFLVDGDGPKARWRLDPNAEPGATSRSRPAVTVAPGERATVSAADPLAGMGLRDWQVEAFAAWASAGARGVVEAVTGTGKTRLAVAATRACLANGGRALVLAPTLELVEQWVREVRTYVPEARVGRLGGGGDDDLHDHHVVIATPHSAAKVPVEPPGLGLLVADEAHRYGAPTWAEALRPAFQMRLALTATYERSDEGIEDILGPYFGEVVTSYGYDRAVPDGVVAPFRIAFLGTALESGEAARYAQLDRQVRQLHADLTGRFGLPRDPRKMFPALAAMVAEGHGRKADPRTAAAAQYLSAVRGRRDVAAQCAGKLDVVRRLGPLLRAHADRSLVFCDTVDQAEHAATLLSRSGLTAETVHGDLPRDKRRIRLAQFKKGNLDVLVAPRVLDEGVDVPEADVAVVLAAFRTRRQMIQRLGRVLRLKPDGRHARLVIAYAKETREDPDRGGHDAFTREVTDVATAVETLDGDARLDALSRFLDTASDHR